jgi:hypothetical protein
VMARTGRRMMPTFPSPSLKFRTVSFPQYGFKASLSGRACPADIPVKPAPGMPVPSTSLPQPFARFRYGRTTWHCVQINPRLPVPLCERPLPLYPRGPWLRSGLCCPRPSSRTTTPSAGLAGTRGFHGPAAYTPRLRCAGAPRRPARPSLLSLPRCPYVPSTLRRWVRGPPPVVRAPRYQASSCYDRVATHETRLCQQYPTGNVFRRCIVRVMLRPVCLPGPPGWLRRNGALCAPTPPSEAPCHPRFSRRPSLDAAGSQARGANGKSPLVGTCTRPVRVR